MSADGSSDPGTGRPSIWNVMMALFPLSGSGVTAAADATPGSVRSRERSCV